MIQILASGATPGVLQPGESVRVPIYYAGTQQPWDFTYPPFHFHLNIYKTDDATPVDWNGLQDSLRPPSINSQAWAPIFANLVGSIGNTWGSYVSTLDSTSAFLGRLGENVTDVSQLWGFQVQQAIGFSTVTHLGDAVVAQMTQPGLPLSFARFFTPSLIGRYQLGVLGWGWTWSGGWQRILTVAPDGTVTIADTDGSQRRFQPDSRPGGGYFAHAGDQGILRNLGGGVFSLQELNGLLTRFRADGRVDYVADTNNNRITAGYTGALLTSLTHSAGEALQIHYNPAGRIDRVTDSANRTTTFTYDPATNEYLQAVQTFDGLITRYTYDQSSDPRKKHALLSIEHPGNTHEYFGYDAQGRLNDTHKDGNAEQVTFSYGPAGRVVAIDAAQNATQYFFDFRGQLAKVIDPLQNTTELAYDNAFNLTQLVDPAGQQYRYQYDAKGNLIRSTDPLGDTVGYVYAGPYDRLTAVTDAMGYQTQYRYDPQGNLLSITYADNLGEQFVPNTAGDPIQWTNARGTPVQYQRDSAGRVRHVVFADASQVDYDYDPVRGTLSSASDASGMTTLRYEDPQHPDRVTKVVYPDGRFLAYQYNGAGQRDQMTDQDGFTVKYRYDAVGRLDRLLDGSDNVIVRYTYYPTGLLQRKDNGNGTYTTYDYTETGQVRHLVNFAPDGSINSRFDYTYDGLGRVATMTTLEGLWTYGYDGIGQLTSVQLPNGRLIQYRYDANGNRTSVTDNGATTAYTSNNRNQYVTVGTVTYGYDADGNMISKRDGNSLTIYGYDDQNRLIRVSGTDGTWTYEYDVFGNRRAVTFNGQRTNYLIDPSGLGDVVGEYNGPGRLVAHYTYGLGLTSRVNPAGEAAYYDFDAIGSTVGVTSLAGGYVNRYSYLPFGERLTTAETIANPFAFVGQYGVTTTGSSPSSMGRRFYDPALGRFMSLDPWGIGSGDINLYRYAKNGPANFIDPTGQAVEVIIPGEGRGVIHLPEEPPPEFPCEGAHIKECYEWTHPEKPEKKEEEPKKPLLPYNIPPGPTWRWENLETPPQWHPESEFQFPWFGTPFEDPQPALTDTNGPVIPPVPSGDPNEKIGPAGFGPQRFVGLDTVFPYRINFENDATATAPAQRVDITDQLASTLDWATFQWTEIGFGDSLINVPPGTQDFQTTVAATYNGRTFDVQIEVGFHSATGQLFATFLSIDPGTSLPPDVLTGFLPPEDGTGRGMGHISYIIRPKTNLSTGTQIRNVARVTFDRGETITTNQRDDHDPSQGTDPAKEAFVTIDAAPPTSSVAALPPTSPNRFTVSWSGTDDPGGSGIGFFDIYVSDNNGPFTLWLGQTTQTSATFTGVLGHHYGFYSVATDNVGNREPTPTAAQAATTVNSSIIQWVAAGGGDWDTPANWDLNRLPTASDEVVINRTGVTVTHASAVTDSIHSLTSQAAINLSGGSLAIAGPSVVSATFTISGATLFLNNASVGGSGSLVDQGTLVAQGNSAVNVSFSTSSSSTLRVLAGNPGDAVLTVAAGFINNGLIELTSTASVAGATLAIGSGTLTNAAAGTVNTLAGGGGSRIVSAQLNNQGTFTIGQDTTVNTSGVTSNSGSINVTGGNLTVNQSGTSSSFNNAGTLTVASGSTLTLSGGVLANFSGGTLTGGTYNVAGTFQFPNAAITTNAANIVLDGPLAQIVNQSAIDALTTFAGNDAAGSFTVQNGRNVTTAGAVAFSNAGTVAVGAGSTFSVTGTLSNFAGTTLTGGAYFIDGTFQFTGANVITNAATIVLDGASAQIVDEANNNALANFAANASAGSFIIQNSSNLTTAGAFSNAGYLSIGYGSTFTATGIYSQTGTASVGAYGTLSLSGGGSSSGPITAAGSLTLGAGTTFTVSGAYTQTGTLTVPAAATLNLTGTFSNFVGSTLTDGTYVIGGTFKFASADIRTNAAIIVLDGAASQIVDQANSDALSNFGTNAANGVFALQNGRNFATAAAIAFSNAGTLSVDNGSSFNVTGAFTNFGSSTLTGGTFVIGGTLQFANADIRTNAATIVLDGTASQIVDQSNNNALANFAVNAAGGSFTIQNNRNFTTSAAATFTNAGTLVIAAGSTFTVGGSLSNFAGTTLTGGTYYLIGGIFMFTGADIRTNAATIVLDGAASQILNQAGVDALGNFSANGAGGSFTVQNGRNFTAAGAFSNAGAVSIGAGSTLTANAGYIQSGGTTDVSGSAALVSAGGVTIQAGILSGSGTVSASVTIQSGGTLSGSETINGDVTVQNGATLSGSETINGNVTSAGVIEVGGAGLAGVLTINGNYTQTASGVLNMEIGGANAGSDFDQLNISGTATLGGTLNVRLLNGYVPPSGSTFQILTFGSHGTSTFQTTNLDPVFQNLLYNAADVTLTAS